MGTARALASPAWKTSRRHRLSLLLVALELVHDTCPYSKPKNQPSCWRAVGGCTGGSCLHPLLASTGSAVASDGHDLGLSTWSILARPGDPLSPDPCQQWS